MSGRIVDRLESHNLAEAQIVANLCTGRTKCGKTYASAKNDPLPTLFDYDRDEELHTKASNLFAKYIKILSETFALQEPRPSVKIATFFTERAANGTPCGILGRSHHRSSRGVPAGTKLERGCDQWCR